MTVDLYLVDTGKLILDRVFDGDELAGRSVDGVEKCVKTGGFTGTGRPCDQKDSVGIVDDFGDHIQVVGVETELRNIQLDTCLIENTHYDTLAVSGGNTRHTQVDVFFAHAHLDTSVLRDTLFGNIQPGHDLQSAGQIGLQEFRRRIHFAQNAVHAVAHTDKAWKPRFPRKAN